MLATLGLATNPTNWLNISTNYRDGIDEFQMIDHGLGNVSSNQIELTMSVCLFLVNNLIQISF